MTINELTKEIHDNAVAHGWWDEQRSFAEVMALCVSELAEALEEDRAGRRMYYIECGSLGMCRHDNCGVCAQVKCIDDDSAPRKPEGIAVEMADCIIRILDWAGQVGVDMEAIILAKHEYNKGRPYKHGKKY